MVSWSAQFSWLLFTCHFFIASYLSLDSVSSVSILLDAYIYIYIHFSIHSKEKDTLSWTCLHLVKDVLKCLIK